MVVAERFSSILDPDAERPLAFDYDPLSDEEEDGDEFRCSVDAIVPQETIPLAEPKKRRKKNKARSSLLFPRVI